MTGDREETIPGTPSAKTAAHRRGRAVSTEAGPLRRLLYAAIAIVAGNIALGAALLDFPNSPGMRGRLTGASPYDSPFYLTIFRVRRRLGWDEETADGTVSGTR